MLPTPATKPTTVVVPDKSRGEHHVPVMASSYCSGAWVLVRSLIPDSATSTKRCVQLSPFTGFVRVTVKVCSAVVSPVTVPGRLTTSTDGAALMTYVTADEVLAL